MVYLAGDNNLSDASIYAMTEMKRVGSGGGVQIVTQFDPRDDYLPTHRYHIRGRAADAPPAPLAEDIIDASKSGGFKEESAHARRHEEVRRAARAKAEEASVEEARRLAQNAARPTAQQQPARETVLLDTRDDPGIGSNETDTGSPVALYNFMSRCVEQFPARHYMVVLAGHGNGPKRDFLLRDDSPAGSLTMNELKRAFQELAPELGGRPIDILGMDTCLMSMAEVAYELRGLVKILVGAESYSPVSGWPYEPILRALKDTFARADEDEEAALTETERVEYRFARSIAERYVNFYADYWLGGLSVDQAALNVGEIEELKRLVDEFADATAAALRAEAAANQTRRLRDSLVLAHWEAQSYNGELFVDLADFCDCLLARQPGGDIARTGAALSDFIKNSFVLKSCYSGPIYQYSYGVSLYFPWAEVEHDYTKLDFIDGRLEKGWGGFLKAYTSLTRRPPRVVPGADAERLSSANTGIRPNRQTEGKGPDGQNRVHSMRNPPIYAEPQECIERREEISEGQMKVYGLQ